MLVMNTTQLFAEVESLPLDLKTKLIEKLLSSITPIRKDIDTLWKDEIDSRINDIDSAAVKLVDGESVFQKIKDQYRK